MFNAEVKKTILSVSKFTASWPGNFIDPLGVIHHLNSQGTRPPIVWVFNAAKEPESFAKAFGIDQPIIALRSLNMVAKQSSQRDALSKRLSFYYSSILSDFLPSSIALIGGNCQGAPFAMWMSGDLLRTGRSIGGVATIDAAPAIDMDIPVLLNFGSELSERNSLRKDKEDAELQYASHYASYQIARLPCGHGKYFNPENVGHLITNLKNFLSTVQAPKVLRNLYRS